MLTILTMTRYLAICHPLYSYKMTGLKRTARLILIVGLWNMYNSDCSGSWDLYNPGQFFRIIVGLWICSALAAAPFFHFTKIHYWRFPLTLKQTNKRTSKQINKERNKETNKQDPLLKVSSHTLTKVQTTFQGPIPSQYS